jgi:hypothetical protein
LRCSATAGAGIRLERSAFPSSYDKAFESVSRHYRRRQGKGKEKEVIDIDDEDDLMNGGKDDVGETQGNIGNGSTGGELY